MGEGGFSQIMLEFRELYGIAKDKKATICSTYVRRQYGPISNYISTSTIRNRCATLQRVLATLLPHGDEIDKPEWLLSSDKQFKMASCYKILNLKGVNYPTMRHV